MKYKNILFDLDGTITDSSPGIINSYKYSLHKFGLTENDENIIRTYIGSPLRAYYSERQKLSHTYSEIAVKFSGSIIMKPEFMKIMYTPDCMS